MCFIDFYFFISTFLFYNNIILYLFDIGRIRFCNWCYPRKIKFIVLFVLMYCTRYNKRQRLSCDYILSVPFKKMCIKQDLFVSTHFFFS